MAALSPIARTDPLAPGVYWIDLFMPFTASFFDPEAVFADWVSRSTPHVKVLRREQIDMIGPGFKAVFTVFFEVMGGPVPAFPRKTIGPPRIVKLADAPGGVTPADRAKTQDDVRANPSESEAPPSPLDFLKNLEQTAALHSLIPWVAIGILAYLWLKSEKGSSHAVH